MGIIFWSCRSCLPTLTTELSALDRIYALIFTLEKVDSLISENQSLKLKIYSLKLDYPYIRAAFRNWTDSTASDWNSKNGNLKAMKFCLLTKSPKIENQKFSRRAQILVIRRQSAQLKGHQSENTASLHWSFKQLCLYG